MIVLVIVIAVAVFAALAVLFRASVSLFGRRLERRSVQAGSLDDVYRSYLAAMHQEAMRFLGEEAPADREWIADLKAQAWANVGFAQPDLMREIEINFDDLRHIHRIQQTYRTVPLRTVAFAAGPA